MSEDEAFRLVHLVALFLFLVGMGGTMLPLYRAWTGADLQAQIYAFREAGRNQAGILLPGIILVGVTGLIWAIVSDHVDPIETGWLLAVEGIYLFVLFVCVPAMAASLRRARLLALHALKSGEVSPALAETLADRGAIVVGTLIFLLVLLMTALAVTRPF